MSVLTKVLGGVGVVAGVAGAAVLGGMTAQRVALNRYRAVGPDPVDDFDNLRSDRSYSVVAEDGVVLHVEEVGPLDADLTVICGHGWALRMGSWHYQRLGLLGPDFGEQLDTELAVAGPKVRMVFYDQRSHGKSTRAGTPHPTIKHLAGDLAEVINTAAPAGPVVLIGHSMGGMALLALAGADPDFFAERVVGVGLVSTSATQLPNAELGRIFMSGSNPVVRVVSHTAVRYSKVLERTRASTRDAVWLATRVLGFARRDVPAALVDYLDQMLTDTPIEVIADFIPGVLSHDQSAALPALAGIPTVVICGEADRITPPSQSLFMSQALPDAEYVLIPNAAHLPMLEAAEETNAALRRMLRRAARLAAKRRWLEPSSA